MMKRVGVSALVDKEIFIYRLTVVPEVIGTVIGKFSAAGIKIYAAGVIYMKTQQEVDKAFAYAKALGVDLIIGSPNIELLGYVEQQVKAYGIRVAIHNHGPEDKLYPSPVDVYTRVKGLDERIGLCLDIGHAARRGSRSGEEWCGIMRRGSLICTSRTWRSSAGRRSRSNWVGACWTYLGLYKRWSRSGMPVIAVSSMRWI